MNISGFESIAKKARTPIAGRLLGVFPLLIAKYSSN
jgi:hypothetical protein